MNKFSYLSQSNAFYIDELLEKYQKDPDSVDESWRYFFEGMELGTAVAGGAEGADGPDHGSAQATVIAHPQLALESKVIALIEAYRAFGKKIADINPLVPPSKSHPALELSAFGLTANELSQTFQAGALIGMGAAKLSDIIERLKQVYASTIGVEFAHIENKEMRDWLIQKFEAKQGAGALPAETRKHILKRLTDSETFERFLHTRYVAQKRFSVEGGEAVIPTLDCLIEKSAEAGAKDVVIGMAHRGRLNVLTNVFGKKSEAMFTEFEGNYKTDPADGEGDVKYHKGYSADVTTKSGNSVHLSLAFNPSHLEFVGCVVEGMSRAKQDRWDDPTGVSTLPIVIHGDAALAGQGVCYETLQMCQLQGYKTGGTVHIVINNQVGFTTDPSDSRSAVYSTDLAKMLDVPVFHVNGDDPEALWKVAELSIEFRLKFKTDVFVDLICYRKHGHNEGDEPTFTQPMLYKKIKAHASPREVYAEKMEKLGVVSKAESDAMVAKLNEKYIEAQQVAKKDAPYSRISVFQGPWKGMGTPTETDVFNPSNTEVSADKLKALAVELNTLPAGFNLHSKLGRFFEARLKAVQDGKGIDWGNGEALAYGSLLQEGFPIRITGQDAERGTFTHRHAVVTDSETGQKFSAFKNLKNTKAKFEVYNSHLSETAVMGFEYGYSITEPHTLSIWEAQFGDFANGAQVIIDQFLATSESKWLRASGLVLLLPHGYEGQGPEHSSARLERFLNLCGRQNMQVCNLTTPAQIFHALRRQVHRRFRKPLVVMSPKSLLRHPLAVSSLDEFTKQGFQEVIDDPTHPKAAKRVLLCSGKVYYDLVQEREKRGKQAEIAIVRVEQLYPWPAEKLKAVLSGYSKDAQFVWVQEEPKNMGAWGHVFGTWMGATDHFALQLGGRPIRYAGRDLAAAPAVGSPKVHDSQQKDLLDQALKD
ncbi:MAG: 2-oxoglutarate dehydrogenase E1 component [Bdellovibrionales bacterium]|nr:2-oxoglutarate dehydrogenase E1 component [Bdellovibrionales bacterium]